MVVRADPTAKERPCKERVELARAHEVCRFGPAELCGYFYPRDSASMAFVSFSVRQDNGKTGASDLPSNGRFPEAAAFGCCLLDAGVYLFSGVSRYLVPAQGEGPGRLECVLCAVWSHN